MDSESAAGAGSSLNRRIARGATWMVGLRFVDRCVGFLSTIVLARLLVPADFGLVSLAMAMIAAVAVFGEFGFELALIQNQTAKRRHYDTAWTLGLIRGLVAGGIIVLAAEPLTVFFEDPRLRDIILWLALLPLLQGFYNVGTVAFRKNLTLGREFVFRIVPRTAGVLVTVTLAFIWRDYWALVWGSLSAAAIRVVMSYIMHHYRPRLSLAAWRDIMDFSKWMVITSISTFINRKVAVFLIGKFLDAASVGTFSIAAQIANMASAEVIAPIKQVLFPGYAKLTHDIALLRKAFLDAYAILVLIALPIAIGIGLTAHYFVPLLLGPKWNGAIPLIEILVISGGLRALSSHVRPVYLAMNRPKWGAYASVGRAIVFLPALYYGLTEYGLTGAALAHAGAQVAVLLGSLYYVHRLLSFSYLDLLRVAWRALTACLLMIATVVVLRLYPPVAGDGITAQSAMLALLVAAGMATYLGTNLLLWWGCGRPRDSAEARLMAYVGGALGGRRGGVSANPGVSKGA